MIKSIIQTAAGPACSVCGRGVGCFLSADESPCQCDDLISRPVRPRRIYVASSWRNKIQPKVVLALRKDGHSVYDFKNPAPGNNGFAWSEIDPLWQHWTARQYVDALDHPVAKRGFACDFNAMKWADTFLLVLPCGRSAHLELGWAVGTAKQTMILTRNGEEPELMAKMCDHICVSLKEVRMILAE